MALEVEAAVEEAPEVAEPEPEVAFELPEPEPVELALEEPEEPALDGLAVGTELNKSVKLSVARGTLNCE